MIGLFDTIFYKPIFNLMIATYNTIPGSDIGITIIILTVIIKLILWPMQQKALRSQKALQEIQPKMEEVKKKYADDKEKMSKAMMELYSKEKVNPFSSCLPLLVQLPVFIALYRAMTKGLESSGYDKLYAFVANPGAIDPSFLGIVDLANPNVVLALLAGLAQFIQVKMMVIRKQPKDVPGAKDEQTLATVNRQMVYFMPMITVFIGMQLPGGLALYWFVMAGLTAVQQVMLFSKDKENKEAEAAS